MPRSPVAPVSVSLFRGVKDPYVARYLEGLAWPDFVDGLRDLLAIEHRAKEQMWALTPARFDEDHRKDANVCDHTCLFIDVDVCRLSRLLKRAQKWRCAVYESPSSTPDEPRVRVVAALPEAYPAHAAPVARAAFARELGLDPDQAGVSKAAAPAQIYFIGRLAGTKARRLWSYDGEVWTPPDAGDAPPRRARATSGEATTPRRGPESLPDLSALVAAIEPDEDGGMYRGGRGAMRALGGLLARYGWHPDAIAAAVRDQIPTRQPDLRADQAAEAAERFYDGVATTAGHQALTDAFGEEAVAELEAAVEDPCCRAIAERWAARARVGTEADAREKREAFAATVGAEHPSEGENGLQLCPATGWPWILQERGSYWVHRVDGTAGYDRELSYGELESYVSNTLGGLISDEDRPMSGLKQRWIKVVRETRHSFLVRANTYDPETQVLTIAALQWAPVRAAFDPDIDRWLRALWGKSYDAGAQWLAALTCLDRPAPCLYMHGDKNVGKTLLAAGIANLWAGKPASMAEAIADFNEAQAKMPLVFADEGFPPGLDFNRFREMVTNHAVRVNAKHKSKASIEGCSRYLVAANNDDLLKWQKVGTLTSADVAAIESRLLVIACRPRAERVLAEFPQSWKDWAAAEGIAAHILHLAETVPLQSSSERMAAAPGNAASLLEAITGARNSALLRTIGSAIGNGSLGETVGVKIEKGGALLLNVSKVYDAVRELDTRVTQAEIRAFCASQQSEPPRQARTAKGEVVRWRVLNADRVRAMIDALD